MSEEKQLNTNVEKLMSDTALNNPATLEGIKNLIDKTAPLVQAGRFDNIIDLLSVISDNIEFLDEAALEKTTKAGEEILALVALKPGKTASQEEIIRFCEKNLAVYKRPKIVEFLPSLPKTSSGKVHKRKLRERYERAIEK